MPDKAQPSVWVLFAPSGQPLECFTEKPDVPAVLSKALAKANNLTVHPLGLWAAAKGARKEGYHVRRFWAGCGAEEKIPTETAQLDSTTLSDFQLKKLEMINRGYALSAARSNWRVVEYRQMEELVERGFIRKSDPVAWNRAGAYVKI